MIHVTRHAIQRYQERVAPLDDGSVRARIHAHDRAIAAAADFGAAVVRLGDGTRLVLDGRSVVTVLGRRGAR